MEEKDNQLYRSFTADQARVICKEAIKNNTNADLIEILKFIKSEAEKGLQKTFYYKHINDTVIKDLIYKGFDVKSVPTQRNEFYYVISWKIN